MSSTIDNIECPKCGKTAILEQNKYLETHIWCNECGYDSDLNEEYKESENVVEVRDPDKVYIVWSWDDIQTLRPGWDEEKCKEALKHIEKGLEDNSVREGWEIIETLLNMEYGDKGRNDS